MGFHWQHLLPPQITQSGSAGVELILKDGTYMIYHGQYKKYSTHLLCQKLKRHELCLRRVNVKATYSYGFYERPTYTAYCCL